MAIITIEISSLGLRISELLLLVMGRSLAKASDEDYLAASKMIVLMQ